MMFPSFKETEIPKSLPECLGSGGKTKKAEFAAEGTDWGTVADCCACTSWSESKIGFTYANSRTFYASSYRGRLLAYSILHLMTLSALARTLGGIVRPICLPVFRLITNSNFVGCSTGRSAGLAPLRILSTYKAARRSKSSTFTP